MEAIGILGKILGTCFNILVVAFFVIFASYLIGYVSAKVKILSYWISCKVSGHRYDREEINKLLAKPKPKE